jgi:hypothetical protein
MKCVSCGFWAACAALSRAPIEEEAAPDCGRVLSGEECTNGDKITFFSPNAPPPYGMPVAMVEWQVSQTRMGRE